MFDGKLNYTQKGKGLPVVLVHGFPFDRRIWREQLDSQSDIAHIIAPDLPGFGGTPPFPASVQPRIEDYAQALVDMISELNLGKVVLAGHSMGGYVALAFARRYPQLLTGLVLVATKPSADTKKARKGRIVLAEDVRTRGAMAVVLAMRTKLFAAAAVRRDPGLADRVRDIMQSQGNDGIIAALHAMADRPSSIRMLADITVPTLVMAGSEDKLMSTRVVREMARKVPGASYIAVKGSGHLPMMEEPDQVNLALRRFLCELQPHKPPGCM